MLDSVKMRAIFLGGSPIYDKDSKDKKIVKSYIANFMEIGKSKDGALYTKCVDTFIPADAVTEEAFKGFKAFDLCELEVSLRHLDSKPYVTGIAHCTDKSNKIELFY